MKHSNALLAAILVGALYIGFIALPNKRPRVDRAIDISKAQRIEELSYNSSGTWSQSLDKGDVVTRFNVYDASGKVNLSRANSILAYFNNAAVLFDTIQLDGESITLFKREEKKVRRAGGDVPFSGGYKLFALSTSGKLLGFRKADGVMPKGKGELLFNFGPFLNGDSRAIAQGAIELPVTFTQQQGG